MWNGERKSASDNGTKAKTNARCTVEDSGILTGNIFTIRFMDQSHLRVTTVTLR